MKKTFLIYAIIFLSGNLFSQGSDNISFQGTSSGFEDMMTYILTSSDEARIALTQNLIPTKEDYDEVFTDEQFAKQIYRYHKRLWRQTRLVIRPLLQNQTTCIFWQVSVDELQTFSNEAKYFPGGYKEIAGYLNPELTYYRNKFVEPGRKIGSAYDMWVHVNGNWRLFPRPWVILF